MNWEIKRYPLFYGTTGQTYPDIKPGTAFLSKSIVVGNFIFLSGFDGRSQETGQITSDKFDDQVIACLDAIRTALEEAGSSMSNLAKNVILLRNIDDSTRMWEIMLEYYQKHAPDLLEQPPAVTVITVVELAKPECLIEIDAMAVLSRDEPGWEMKKIPML